MDRVGERTAWKKVGATAETRAAAPAGQRAGKSRQPLPGRTIIEISCISEVCRG